MNPSPPPSLKNRSNGRTRQSRRWIPWGGAALLGALLVAGFWPKPTLVETTRAAYGPLQSSINEEGKTRIKQRYIVSAPVAGQLRRVAFKAGDEIASTNLVVAVIDPVRPSLLDPRARALAEARRDNAAAQVARATSAHSFALIDLKRGQTLFQQNTISKQELEQDEWHETSTASDLAAAEAALRQAEAELREFTNPSATNPTPIELTAPVPGRVLKVIEESARSVSVGTQLLEIGDPANLEVAVEVLSRDGAAIQPGTAVDLEQWGGSSPLKARVRLVEPAAFTKVSALGVEEQRVYVVADLLTAPAERGNLGDNFRVEARIITWQTERTLKVPNGALYRIGDKWSTYLISGGRTVARGVTIGHSSSTETEIVDGLKEGEEVVLYPGDRITPGMRVKPIKL
jgi:HlyD family secretion protein